MAAGIINLQKASGGITKISSVDGTGVTELVVPESGELATTSNLVGFKNYIINGNFDIWQRGNLFSVAPGEIKYTADRWIIWNRSNQPLTFELANTAPFSNLDFKPRVRISYSVAPTSGDVVISQRVEDVRKLAGKTLTGSFYHSSLENLTLHTYTLQNYGLNGSSDTTITNISQSTTGDLSFKRYTTTFSIPNLKDKTIGDNSWGNFTIVVPIRTTRPFSISEVQLEEGSVATPFEQRPIGLELSLCQRYYYYWANYDALYRIYKGYNGNTTTIPFPITMRTAPTSIEYQLQHDGINYTANAGVSVLQTMNSGVWLALNDTLFNAICDINYIKANAEL